MSLFYQIVKNAGSQTADNTALTSPLAVGTGVKVVSTQKLFTQGGLVSTDNSLDLAIDGSGFFRRYCLMDASVTLELEFVPKCGRSAYNF